MKKLSLTSLSLTLFIISIFILVLILAQNILVPFALSIFFAYLFYPLVARIERWGVQRGISILLVILIAILLVGGAGLLVSAKLSNMTINFTELKEQFDTKAESLQHVLENKIGVNPTTMDHYVSRVSESIFKSWESEVGSFFSATTTTIFQIGLLPVFIFFLLFYRTKTAYFIFKLVRRENKPKTVHIMREVSTVTTQYMGGMLIVVVILAVLNSTGLLIIGVPNALAFGVLAAILNLIPYIGTFIGGLIPVIYILITSAHPFQTVIQITILFSIVQFLENNLITPNIVGNNIKINPLAIILSLLLANLVWGIAGMVIAVPCLAILKIIMRNIDQLEPFAYLISDRGTSKYEVSLKRIWKRIKKKHT
ncbi:AI-2E family transporter [uncultured Sunxiuqinia sp.]|uniref:AI-2E family transporter n=1 Tax=uncultured Sunxiuqinia sp. TaxID=1573825 RepID=UPI002AA933F8|nr:AI-2E family transporter [uncultured Sunxiuqinia sp.]